MKMNNQNEIRIGITCNGETLEYWQRKCLNKLLTLNYVNLVLIIVTDKRNEKTSLFKIPFNRLLFTYFRRTWFKHLPRKHVKIPLFKKIDKCYPELLIKKKFSKLFTSESISEIKKYNLDIILHFGRGILRGEILTVPTYGIWGFHHGNIYEFRGSPSGFWEIFHNQKYMGAVLQRLTEELDNGIILKQGQVKLIPHSYQESIKIGFLQSTSWPFEVCQDIHNGKATYIEQNKAMSLAPIYTPPTNWQMIIFFFKILKNKIIKYLKL